jgi:hypothetical protein
MSAHRKPRPKVSKRPTPDNLNPGDLIIRARTAKLLWRVAHAARATLWAPETEDGGEAVYAVLDDAIEDLDAHVRSGCA